MRKDKLLHYLHDYSEEFGYPPTIREMQLEIGASSSAPVRRLLRELQDEGALQLAPGVSRAIRLTPLCSCSTPCVYVVFSLLSRASRTWCVNCARDAR